MAWRPWGIIELGDYITSFSGPWRGRITEKPGNEVDHIEPEHVHLTFSRKAALPRERGLEKKFEIVAAGLRYIDSTFWNEFLVL